MKGYIVKGIGGFYYVKTEEGVIECKPRGIFRKQKITPVAGDEVTLETENGAAVIAEIAPRKNVFVRPPVANLDVLFLVASTTQPTPSTLVLDKLSAIAVDKGVQPVIVCTKADLGEVEFLRSAYERSTLPFIAIRYDSGEGLDEVRQWISGRLCAFCGNSGVGKSTLLNVMGGLLKPDAGSILFKGEDITHESTDKRAKAGMFLSFQEPLEVPGLTLEGFIRSALQQKVGHVRYYDFKKELARCMDILQMDASYAERSLNVGFSGGEKKKAEILQLMMLKPSLAILDETDSGLDVDAVRLVSKGVEEYQKDHNGALLIITHSTRILDALSVDYTHVLVNGKIAANGDGSLVEEINVNGYERFEKMAEA